MVLGAVSVASAGFLWVRGDFQFVQMRGGGLVVALAFGALAGVAGWLASRVLTVAAGAGFLLAVVVQLVLLAGGSGGFLQGNGSTVSLWLGLGTGLVAVGAAPQQNNR